MSKTPEQVQALKAGIQAWLARNGLADDVYWADVQGVFEGREPTFGHAVYLVFSYNDEFNDVRRGAHPSHARDLILELDDIVKRHGCGMESYEGPYLAVYDQQPRDEEQSTRDRDTGQC